MKSRLDTKHVVFFVNDRNMVEILSEHVQKIGYKVTDASSADDFLYHIRDRAILYLRKSEAKTPRTIHKDLIKLLTTVSSRISTISIVTHDLSHVKIAFNAQNSFLDYHQTISEVERDHIINTLDKCGWQYKNTAQLLGINRTTLYRKMKKYGIKKKLHLSE